MGVVLKRLHSGTKAPVTVGRGKKAELKLLTRSRPLRELGCGHSKTAKGIMKGHDL